MAFCPECGKPAADQATKCASCGKELSRRRVRASRKGTMMMTPGVAAKAASQLAPPAAPVAGAAPAPAPAGSAPPAPPAPIGGAPAPAPVGGAGPARQTSKLKHTMVGTGMPVPSPAAPAAVSAPPAASAAPPAAPPEATPEEEAPPNAPAAGRKNMAFADTALGIAPAPAIAPAPTGAAAAGEGQASGGVQSSAEPDVGAAAPTPETPPAPVEAISDDDAGRFLAGDPMAPPRTASPQLASRQRAFPTPLPGRASRPVILIVVAILGVLIIAGIGIAVGASMGLIDPPL